MATHDIRMSVRAAATCIDRSPSWLQVFHDGQKGNSGNIEWLPHDDPMTILVTCRSELHTTMLMCICVTVHNLCQHFRSSWGIHEAVMHRVCSHNAVINWWFPGRICCDWHPKSENLKLWNLRPDVTYDIWAQMLFAPRCHKWHLGANLICAQMS